MRIKRFEYNVLRAATNNFAEARKLGQGGYGAVYKVLTHQPATLWNTYCALIFVEDLMFLQGTIPWALNKPNRLRPNFAKQIIKELELNLS